MLWRTVVNMQRLKDDASDIKGQKNSNLVSTRMMLGKLWPPWAVTVASEIAMWACNKCCKVDLWGCLWELKETDFIDWLYPCHALNKFHVSLDPVIAEYGYT